MSTQVEIVGESASQADGAGSIPVTGSSEKPTLTRADANNYRAGKTGTAPYPVPNALIPDPRPNPAKRTELQGAQA